MTRVAVRVRGSIGVRDEIRDTLEHLRLHKPNHAVVVPEGASWEGMLRKARAWLAYGEADEETLALLLRARARVPGDALLTDEYVRAHSKFQSIEELARALARGEARLADVEGLKPVLRLNPPRKGYGGNKRFYPAGALGDWGKDINGLLRRMV